VKAPTCKICGNEHWSRLCYDRRDEPAVALQPKPVALPATPKLVAPSALKAALDEVEALRCEVIQLKRELADSGTRATACPECERRRQQVADRVRKSRARAK
jgi:hypothetical protein